MFGLNALFRSLIKENFEPFMREGFDHILSVTDWVTTVKFLFLLWEARRLTFCRIDVPAIGQNQKTFLRVLCAWLGFLFLTPQPIHASDPLLSGDVGLNLGDDGA